MGAGRSSEVERSLMVRLIVGSILHGVDPLSYSTTGVTKAVLSCLWDCAYKIPLVANRKSSPCSGGSEFPLSLSEWLFTIYPTPYVV